MRTWGGAEVWILETALALTDSGHRVSVVAQPGSELLARCRDAGVAAADVVNAAAGAEKTLIDEVRVFDEFVGGSLGEGKKSLAITVRMQPRERTLTEEQIEAVGAKVVEKVTKATGGVLRG